MIRFVTVGALLVSVSVVAAIGSGSVTRSVVADGSSASFVSVSPERVLDTRSGSGPVAPGSPVTVELAGVPAGAAAAVVNVTATGATGDGFFTVWDCDGPAPGTSNGNYVGIGTVAANVITATNADSEICVATGDAAADVLVDVMGYYPAGSGVVTSTPTRSLDTRASSGGSGPVTPGNHVTATLGDIPADAAAAIVNVTATNATADGFFTVWNCDGPAPDTSNGNYVGVSTIANSAITPIGTGSQICVQTGDGAADILVDTVGYLTAESGYTAATPARLFDTRTADTPLTPGDTATITLTDVPAGDTAIVNVTAANTQGDGYFTVWNCDGPAPGTSNGNYVGVTTIANTAIITPNADQQICVQTGDAAAHIIIDTTGHTTSTTPPPTTTTPPPTTTTPPPTTTQPAPGTPAAPTITSVDRGDTQLTVNFTAGVDGGSAITNYEYSTDDGGTWTTRDPVSTALPIVITGLVNGTEYEVKIRAVNAVGSGAESNMVAGTPAAPSVGDTGPGGGIVFYVAPNDGTFTAPGTGCDTGCRYLEAAPTNWNGGSGGDPGVVWSGNTNALVPGGTQLGLGFGYQNTKNAVEQSSTAPSAVTLAFSYENNELNDWFLPSKDELNELCKYARQQTTGDTATSCDHSGERRDGFVAVNYWSSSEADANDAWSQSFNVGDQSTNGKTLPIRVRPVRAF